LSDKIRPESAGAIKTLKENNIKSILLTGDNDKVAKSVSETLGMDSYIAQVLPDQKLKKIKELQKKGEFVAMTGDGVNDAPALAQADVGIAVGSGSDIAAETAGIVLVNSNPKDIVNLILFGKATHAKMIQNLIWATGYNIVALPLAAGVLYSWHILLTPAVGAVLMSASTVIVSINAGLLRLKEEPKSETNAEPKTEAIDETKPESKDDSQPEEKDESKPEAKAQNQTEDKDKAMTEAKADSETNEEPMPEANAETKPEAKTAPQSKVKDKTKNKAGAKSEASTNISSTVTPEIVKKVHEFYEELGREDVRAVMDMEKTEQEIPKSETKLEDQPETKNDPKSKDEQKPEVEAIHQPKDNVKNHPDTKTKVKSEVKVGHKHVVKAKPKPGSKK
ncbi:MAG: HAD-IC family P-type ATPase, partial [Paludibacter sp.]